MTDARSLAVQSVLYGNATHEVTRAARAVAHSAALAVEAGVVGAWTYRVGDCSPEPALDQRERDAIGEIVASAGGTFDHVYFGENLGSARGHNSLAERGAEDMLLILNPDAVVGPDTVTRLAEQLLGDIGITEARQIPLEHPKDYAPATGDTSWASTACALTSRTAFDAAGGFDPDTFFLYCDDVDYSWRVRLAGYRVVYVPSAAVFHDKRLNVDGSWPAGAAERYYSAEAALLLPIKYSRPDVAKRVRGQLRRSGAPEALRAIAEVDRRREAGLLPTPIDHDHKVSEFIGPNYARHRFP